MAPARRTTDPVEIAYEIAGEGPVVIFLHGLGGNRWAWTQQLRAFSREFCCVAWDARGSGDSDDPPGNLDFRDFGSDLACLLDCLGAETAHLVGQSMGAMTILEFWKRHPNRVATMVLCGASPGVLALGAAAQRQFLRGRLEPLENGEPLAEYFQGSLDHLLAPSASLTLRAEIRDAVQRVRRGPYLQMLRALAKTDFRAVLPVITVPTLLVVGEGDRIAPPNVAQAMATAIPGAQMVQVNDSGHLPNREQPEAFNRAVRSFLADYANRATRLSAAKH